MGREQNTQETGEEVVGWYPPFGTQRERMGASISLFLVFSLAQLVAHRPDESFDYAATGQMSISN